LQNNFYLFDLVAPKIDFDIFNKIDRFFSSKDKKYIEYHNSKLENKRLEKIHDNIKIIINENGHLFLINRLNNKVYFFYKDDS
jgi:folate-dependent tRNA-U54 methylase TrmFO/GidA